MAKNNNVLKFRRPASLWGAMWREGLPTGNGTVGCSVYGGAGYDTIVINHNDLWWQGHTGVLPDVSDKIKTTKTALNNGHFEEAESPEDCALREVREETGLTLTHYEYRGIVTFISDKWESELMHLFWADAFIGELKECNEGDLIWVDKHDLLQKALWQGDKIFLQLLEERPPFFSLKLRYEGEALVQAVLNGKEIAI